MNQRERDNLNKTKKWKGKENKRRLKKTEWMNEIKKKEKQTDRKKKRERKAAIIA